MFWSMHTERNYKFGRIFLSGNTDKTGSETDQYTWIQIRDPQNLTGIRPEPDGRSITGYPVRS